MHKYEDIANHFWQFEKARNEYSIKPENCWNFNETGWRIGCLKGCLVFTFLEVSTVYISDPDTRESLTSLEAINTIRDAAPSILSLPDIILFKGEFDNDIDNNVLFRTNTETGSRYSNDQLAIDWLEYFERMTHPGVKTCWGIVHSNEWRLLIMDSHGSHLTIEFMDIC